MLEAVLFDIGDTLMHFETSQARRFIEAGVRPVYDRLITRGHVPPSFRAYTGRIRRAFVRAYVKSRIVRREVPTLEVVRRVHARMGIPLADASLAELAVECIRPFERFFATDPDAVPVLSRLSEAGLKLGIVSNTFFPHFAIDEVLEKEGLLSYFPVRVYSSDVGYMKPHPAIFEAALAGLGVAAAHTAHVGDKVGKDVKGAARLGITSVLIVHDQRAVLGRPRADYVIRRLPELLSCPGIAARVSVPEDAAAAAAI